LIYLDSTVRQSTGFERSAFEQRHKIAISRAFSERTFAPARSVATPARSAAKIKKFGSKDSPLISRGFFRCRRGDFFAAEDKRNKRKKPAETSQRWEVQTAPRADFSGVALWIAISSTAWQNLLLPLPASTGRPTPSGPLSARSDWSSGGPFG
jgi:hypothetical protein